MATCRAEDLRTPVYLVDEAALTRNLEILHGVEQRTGCHVLLAQKAFSMFKVYPLVAKYLSGATASGLYEARLAHEELGKENHVFCPAYTDGEMAELCRICDHISFNSLRQLEHHRPVWQAAGVSVGLRVNPEHSTQEGHAIYDPCAPGSRLGIPRAALGDALPDGVEGLHFHTLCEQDADALAVTLDAVAEKFGDLLPRMQWLNFGGGHHITRPGYGLATLERCIARAQRDWGVTVYLEPGEACALNAGYLLTRVLDVVRNGDTTIAILDASAACHMPDVLEMPYRPNIIGSAEPGEKAHTYRLGGPTCLAGDIIGDYSFDRELRPGDQLVFTDMAIYSFCKNNTFNGMPLPALGTVSREGGAKVVKAFGYENFKVRLGKG